MPAFDLQAAARQGRSGTIPPTWTRFPISRVTLWLNFISYGLGALIFLTIPLIYLLITRASSQNISLLEALVAFILGLIFLRISLGLLPPVIQRARHFLLVTPDGFVQVAGRKVVGLAFTEISSARAEPGLLGAKLVVHQRAGKALVLPIGRIYGGRTLRKMEEALSASAKAQAANATAESQKKSQTASAPSGGQKKVSTVGAKASSPKRARKARHEREKER